MEISSDEDELLAAIALSMQTVSSGGGIDDHTALSTEGNEEQSSPSRIGAEELSGGNEERAVDTINMSSDDDEMLTAALEASLKEPALKVYNEEEALMAALRASVLSKEEDERRRRGTDGATSGGQGELNGSGGHIALDNSHQSATPNTGGCSDVARHLPVGGDNPSSQRGNSRAPWLRIMSWNIDGLDDDTLRTRTEGVCRVIKQQTPDAVFLQEVVPASYAILKASLQEYILICAGDQGYFVLIALRIGTAVYEDHSIESFTHSLMSRNLLSIKCTIRDIPLILMTSHLESTKSSAAERQRQLKMCFDRLETDDPHRIGVFGGDLNLRDTELAKVGGVPANTVDLWEAGGRRDMAKFTWDMKLNDNKEMPPGVPKSNCRCRFDRLYMRQPPGVPPKLKPVYFELVGIERLKGCKRFCSDHWGILAHLDIL